MPILLYGGGAVAFAIGVAVIGFGIPINEFSFGNTLIVAGTTAATGGLVIIAIGVAVAQLQRLADVLATRAPVRSSRPFDTFEAAGAAPGRSTAAPARVPFPPKTKVESKPEQRPEPRPEPAMREARFEPPAVPAAPFQDRASDFAAPTLPNPDEPPVTAADEALLSPLHPASYSSRTPAAPAADTDRASDAGSDRALDASVERNEPVPPPTAASRKSHTYFDAMWPAEPKPEPKPAEQKPAEANAAEPRPVAQRPDEAKLAEPKPPAFPWASARRDELGNGDAADELDEEDAPRAVAILKSGVVDGMGYTLYVDGSIEAELPQGTLRFASINELRSHLEKTS